MNLSLPFFVSYAALWVLVVLQSLILLGIVGIIYRFQQSSTSSGSANVAVGKDAPKFSAVDLFGLSIESADYAGRLTALLFVSHDCHACRETLENDMDYLMRKAKGNVILICRAERQDCMRLVEQYELKVPIIVDRNNQLSELYGISSVPTTVLIDANNRILSYGQPRREEIEAMIQPVPIASEARAEAAG